MNIFIICMKYFLNCSYILDLVSGLDMGLGLSLV